MTKTCLKSLNTQMLNVTMFHHLNTNRWDLHINQPQGESCIKHVCCISRMNFYRSDFKHKIYGLYTGKYGILLPLEKILRFFVLFTFVSTYVFNTKSLNPKFFQKIGAIYLFFVL